MNMVELNIREDFSFIWESDEEKFKVVVENCDINIKKIGLFAIKGDVKNQMGWKVQINEKEPFAVNIPFDKVGYILSAFQRNSKFKVISMTYGLNCLYLFTEPIHGK
jgi:hypothetical protein